MQEKKNEGKRPIFIKLDLWQEITELSDADRGKIMQAFFAVHGVCEMPVLSGKAQAIFLKAVGYKGA